MWAVLLLACGGGGDVDSAEVPDTWGPATSTEAVQVELETSLGTLVLELDPEAAPYTVGNFLGYVDAGFYDGADGEGATTFHRVIAGFVVQGGGLTADLDQKRTKDPIVNESDNGLLNLRGTVSMARQRRADSATSQFFVNHADNPSLDPVGGEPGYTVFGRVVDGLDVLDAIAVVPTESVGRNHDVPVEPVVIGRAARR